MAPKGRRSRRPATTPENRESQLVSLAMDLAEKQMTEGTASAQVITHYLKLGTVREQMERDKIVHENELLRAKADGMASARKVEELYEEALRAMRTYAGQEIEEYGEG
jgi:hypothetical protein